jgi:hypothetical protein
MPKVTVLSVCRNGRRRAGRLRVAAGEEVGQQTVVILYFKANRAEAAVERGSDANHITVRLRGRDEALLRIGRIGNQRHRHARVVADDRPREVSAGPADAGRKRVGTDVLRFADTDAPSGDLLDAGCGAVFALCQ